MINGAGFDQNMVEVFQKINNFKYKQDNYNQEKVKFIIKKNNKLTDNIAQKMLDNIDEDASVKDNIITFIYLKCMFWISIFFSNISNLIVTN